MVETVGASARRHGGWWRLSEAGVSEGGSALASSLSRQPANLGDRCRWSAGPVVRFIVFWKNTPTDVNAFERHYREVHIPLARKLAGLRRYTLSRNASVVRGEEPHYRIAELDWDDMASLRRAFESPEGRDVAEDVAKLAELSPDPQSEIYELEDV